MEDDNDDNNEDNDSNDKECQCNICGETFIVPREAKNGKCIWWSDEEDTYDCDNILICKRCLEKKMNLGGFQKVVEKIVEKPMEKVVYKYIDTKGNEQKSPTSESIGTSFSGKTKFD